MQSFVPNNVPLHRSRASRGVLVACYVLLAGVLAYVLIARHFLPLYLSDPIDVVSAPSAFGQSGTTLPAFVPADMRVDPNTATAAELMHVRGIGEITAKNIIDYRKKQHADSGRPVFRSVEDLTRIRGIGPKTAEKMRPQLRFPGSANETAGKQE
jgi:competence protein ComEA